MAGIEPAPATTVPSTEPVADEPEDLEEVDWESKRKDPFYRAHVVRDGFHGQVEDIEQGTVTKERLYRIRYDDGDLEHFTLLMVSQYEVVAKPALLDPFEPPVKIQRKADFGILKRPAAAAADGQDADGHDDGEAGMAGYDPSLDGAMENDDSDIDVRLAKKRAAATEAEVAAPAAAPTVAPAAAPVPVPKRRGRPPKKNMAAEAGGAAPVANTRRFSVAFTGPAVLKKPAAAPLEETVSKVDDNVDDGEKAEKDEEEGEQEEGTLAKKPAGMTAAKAKAGPSVAKKVLKKPAAAKGRPRKA